MRAENADGDEEIASALWENHGLVEEGPEVPIARDNPDKVSEKLLGDYGREDKPDGHQKKPKATQGKSSVISLMEMPKDTTNLPILELPTDRPRPKKIFREHDVVGSKLPIAVRHFLEDPAMVAALWAIVMCRHSLQSNVVIGVVNGVCDSSPVHVLLEVPRQTSWALLLAQAKSGLQAAHNRAMAPVGSFATPQTTSKMKNNPDESRAMIFQTAIFCTDSGYCDEFPMDENLLDCDLVFIYQQGASWVKLSYNTGLFDSDSATRILNHSIVLLKCLIDAQPETEVWRLPMTTSEEQTQLSEFNNSKYPITEACLHDMVEDQAKRTPNNPAVACGAVNLSYAQLMDHVKELAAVLQDAGVKEGSIVGLLLSRTEDIIIAELGIMKAGGAFLPMDTAWPADRLSYILDDASCGFLLLHKSLAPSDLPGDIVTFAMQKGRAFPLGQRARHTPASEVACRRDSLVRRNSSFLARHTPAGEGACRRDSLVRRNSSFLARHTPTGEVACRRDSLVRRNSSFLVNRRQSLDGALQPLQHPWRSHKDDVEVRTLATPRSLAYIIYTSGTTGTPKGTLIEHRSTHNFVMMCAKIMGGPENMKRFAFNAPYIFDASVFEQFVPLSCGGCSVVCENPFEMPDDITTFWNVPSALATMSRLPSMAKDVVTAGEAMTEAALQNICIDALGPGQLPPRIINMYGPTECGIGATFDWVGTTVTGKIGRPFPNVQCYVVDPELLVPQPIGVAGELLIGGMQVGRGYLNRPDLTAEKFIRCPWDDSLGRLYRSGDLVRWLPTGELLFLGRIDFQVKLRGKRIELGEIENALSAPGCDVVVLLREDFDDSEPRLVAYLNYGDTSLASPGWDDIGQILRKAHQNLPKYMVPSAVIIVKKWLYTAGGKLDRKSLPKPTSEDLKAAMCTELDISNDIAVEMVAPRNKTERAVVDAMARVLNIEPGEISVFGDFFTLGGTSLSAARLIQSLGQGKFAANITVTDLMKHSTPSSLAACILGKDRRADMLRRMTVRTLARKVTTKKNHGSQTLWQARIMSMKDQTMPSTSLRFHGPLTFCGMCIMQLPTIVAMSIIIYGCLVILDSPNIAVSAFALLGAAILSPFSFLALVILLKRSLGTVTSNNWDRCHHMKSGVMWRIWFARNLCRQMEGFFSMSIWHETFIVILLARAMGANVGRDVVISSCSGLFSEAERIRVGDNAVIEVGARICTLAFIQGGVLPACTVIADNCVVGVKGMVEAGAHMKPGSVIQPRCTSANFISNTPILRSFPRPKRFMYVPVIIFAVSAHALALMPIGLVAYFIWDYLSKTGALPGWNQDEFTLYLSAIAIIALPTLACLPVCSLLYFIAVVGTKKLLGSPQLGPLVATSEERTRWLLMNSMMDSPLLFLLWFVPHTWQRKLLRCSGSSVGHGAFVFLEVLRYDSHLIKFEEGSAIGGDLQLWCCVPNHGNDVYESTLVGRRDSQDSSRDGGSEFIMKNITLGACSAATHGAVISGGSNLGVSSVIGDYTVVDNTNIIDGASFIGMPAVKTGQLSQEEIQQGASSIRASTFTSDLFGFLVWLFIFVSSNFAGILAQGVCVLLSLLVTPLHWTVAAKVLIASFFVGILADLVARPFIAIAVMAAAKRTILRLPERSIPFYTWDFHKWLFSNMVFAHLAPWLESYYGTEMFSIFFRLCGAKVGRGVVLLGAGGPSGQGNIRNELEHLVIEDNVTIDTDSLIQGHVIENGGMTFKKTVLGANSILSSRSNVLPGARVGRGCNLLEGTLIPPHTEVPECSIVAGCPFEIIVRQDKITSTTTQTSPAVDVDHIVVGAGVSGVVAAKELKAKGKSFVVLEKAGEAGGVWASIANAESHVATIEPSYRFDFEEDSMTTEDFPESSRVRCKIQHCLDRFELSEHIRFGAFVTKVGRHGSAWKVVYQYAGREHVIHSRGVYIAVGTQQTPRQLVFPGEKRFEGAIGYGIRDDIKSTVYSGKNVCIIGGGAFAIENMRTALINGAKKVIIISRNKLQCWPRVVHYRISCGDATWGELGRLYNKAVTWANLTGVMDSFMSPTTTSQPTASDFFFLAVKEGRLDVIIDQALEILPGGILTKEGKEISCDVILKCVGWEKAKLKNIYTDFEHRNFCFLNGYASLVTCSDTVYSHLNDPTFNMEFMEDKIASGSPSVVFLAMAIIRLQLFFMDKPDKFTIALRQIVNSHEPTCSWMQEKLHYEDLHEANAVVQELFKLFHMKTKEKFPETQDFLCMCKAKFRQDAARFLDQPCGYIYD